MNIDLVNDNVIAYLSRIALCVKQTWNAPVKHSEHAYAHQRAVRNIRVHTVIMKDVTKPYTLHIIKRKFYNSMHLYML